MRVRVHTPQFCSAALVMNPENFPEARVGDVYRLRAAEEGAQAVLLRVEAQSLSSKGRMQLSVDTEVADLFGLREVEVEVHKAELHSSACQFVELMIKNQYLSRVDQWRLCSRLRGSPLYVGQTVRSLGMVCSVSEMWGSGGDLRSALVAQDTKLVFRSCSARYFLMWQVSREMLEFASDGDTYFEKGIKSFLTELFQRWNEAAYDHTLSVVLFSRTVYANEKESKKHIKDARKFPTDADHRFYKDFYSEVCHMENRSDWRSVILDLKRAFGAFTRTMHWSPPHAVNSSASEGNVLEAINLALNVYDKHYVNRDLRRTGQQIILVTAGNGMFTVDESLNSLTKYRIMEGIGLDIVCLSPRPLHSVPLFKFHSSGSGSFYVPAWFYVCYVKSDGQGQSYTPSCKVRDLTLNQLKEPPRIFVPYELNGTPQPLARLKVNPFSTTAYRGRKQKITASRRRWISLYHELDESSAQSSLASNPNYKGLLLGINWKSLTTPAALPLTTDFFPSETRLRKKWTEHPYTMSLLPGENSFEDDPIQLLTELMHQRLTHGYQLVLNRQDSLEGVHAYYLSMGRDFQILSYDPIVNQDNVEVKIFHKERAGQTRFVYHYELFTDDFNFRQVRANISHDVVNHSTWNLMDRFTSGLTGQAGDVFGSLKFWRIGFILLPEYLRQQEKAKTDIRLKAVENFQAFKESMETIKLKPGQPRRSMDVSLQLPMISGKLERSAFDAIIQLLILDGDCIRDRRQGFRTVKECASGKEIVDFVLETVDVSSRQEAHALANQMLFEGYLVPVQREIGPFRDNSLYRAVRNPSEQSHEAEPEPLSMRSSVSSASLRRQNSVSKSPDFLSAVGALLAPRGIVQHRQVEEDDRSGRKLVRFSVETGQPDGRHEWLYVAHEMNFNPQRTFFIAIQWLVCSGVSVNDWIDLITRKAKSYSMALIQVPLNRYQTSDPFFLPRRIPFTPERLGPEEKTAFQSALLQLNGFVLMDASSFEYVHLTGGAFISVSDVSFRWYDNKLLLVRDKSESGLAQEMHSLFLKFRQTIRKYAAIFNGSRFLTKSDMEEMSDLRSLMSKEIAQRPLWDEVLEQKVLAPPAAPSSEASSMLTSTEDLVLF